MIRRLHLVGALAVMLVGSTLLPSLEGSAASSAPSTTLRRVAASLPSTLTANLPVLRLHFNVPTKASILPPLVIRPALATQWQQIGPDDVQAVATSTLRPSTAYTFNTPTQLRCAKTCAFVALRPRVASVSTNLTWEAQLLAELNYLPLTFTPGTDQSSPSDQVNGTFTWAYPNLPTTFSSQWSLGTDNIILQGALRTFQSQANLPVTGVADATTWTDLVNAVNANHVDPATYNYVDVTESSPEVLTLYVAGRVKFRALVNTGISVAPTALGTYPVYERFVTTTMSGTNPDGSHYADSGIPWVSYFNGGDALHGFIRSSYGFPQSLGCVEMPFASAKVVFPYTPIGTLVTVRA
ncbi:MAG TPA: L,D-transpeptidase family protein [Acidimicrobiales bacterium]|nr:L,D-transpeptidase family protein [Acidimicrobiales bacterium]